MRRVMSGVATALFITSCASTIDYLEFRQTERPQIVAARLLKAVDSCWFGENRDEFSAYRREAELQSHSNRPRILLVKAGEPGGLPQLIIEASRERRRTSVKLFGPLLNTPLGPRIRGDVDRWTGGRTNCG